jgi:hypothetical protein
MGRREGAVRLMSAYNRRSFLLCALLLLPACEDDPAAPEPGTGESPRLLPLTTRNAILNNIEVAWNRRDEVPIDELLDENYTFYFAPGDVGGDIPPQWSRATDLEATTRLFDSNQQPDPPADPVCVSVKFDLQFDPTTITWVEIPAPVTAFGEVWYTTTVFYNFTLEVEPDVTLIPQNGAKAQFTVRSLGNEWRLVEIRDLGGDTRSVSSVAGVAENTWGAIKSLYDYGISLGVPGSVFEAMTYALESKQAAAYERAISEQFAFSPTEQDSLDQLFVDTSVYDGWTKGVEMDVFGLMLSEAETIDVEFNPAILINQTTFVRFRVEYALSVVNVATPTETTVYAGVAQFDVRNEDGNWRLTFWDEIQNVPNHSTWGYLKGSLRLQAEHAL